VSYDEFQDAAGKLTKSETEMDADLSIGNFCCHDR
jgi:hypothetical protein